jgi:DNA-binding NtrC family response regulator
VILCPYDSINEDCLPRKLKVRSEEDTAQKDEFNLFEIERRVIVKALETTSWNQSKSADLLGVTRKQLRTKMKNLGLLPAS